jgi:hypothetical protein
MCPSVYYWRRGYVASYNLPQTQTRHPLKEKRTKDSTKPKVFVPPHPTLCQLPFYVV